MKRNINTTGITLPEYWGGRLTCLLRGHAWAAPITINDKRIDQCERCAATRAHVAPVVDPTKHAIVTQETIDGSRGAPTARVAIVDDVVVSIDKHERAVERLRRATRGER